MNMNMNRTVYTACFIALAFLQTGTAQATEGASGRPVAGAGVNPGAGVVPATPGWLVNYTVQHVEGEIDAEREVPYAGRVIVGAKNVYTVQSFTLLRVWDTGPGAWNFASAVTLPVMDNSVTATGIVPAFGGSSLNSRVRGLFDLAITPIIAGYHFSPTEHGSLSLRVWVPSGRYESGQLANLSHNVWTFIPTASYTRLLPEQGVELSASTGLNFSTTNKASGYRNAPLFTLDLLATKKVAQGWAVGGVVGWIEQLGPDQGTLADRLKGFRGSEVAIGPIGTYSTRVGTQPLSMSLRWLTGITQKNRFDRDMIQFSLSLPL